MGVVDDVSATPLQQRCSPDKKEILVLVVAGGAKPASTLIALNHRGIFRMIATVGHGAISLLSAYFDYQYLVLNSA